MIAVSKIYTAWLADFNSHLKSTLGIKTVDAYEGSFDSKTLQQMILLSPFALVQCTRNASHNRTSVKTNESEQTFNWVVGAQNILRKQQAVAGVQDILDEMRERYDGMILSVEGKPVKLKWQDEIPVWSDEGLIVYQQNYSIIN